MNDLIRIGRISTINYKKGTAKVVYKDRDDMVTGDLPFLAGEYKMPQIDDLVVVLHFKKGRNNGVILGPLFHEGNLPKNGEKNRYCKEFTGKAGMEAKDGKLKISAENIEFECDSGSITLAQIISHIQ